MIVACLIVAVLGYGVALVKLSQWLRRLPTKAGEVMLPSCDACGCAYEGHPFIFGTILICHACAQAELTALHDEIVTALWADVRSHEAISGGKYQTDAPAVVTAEPAGPGRGFGDR